VATVIREGGYVASMLPISLECNPNFLVGNTVFLRADVDDVVNMKEEIKRKMTMKL
jgi:hypothetical protein